MKNGLDEQSEKWRKQKRVERETTQPNKSRNGQRETTQRTERGENIDGKKRDRNGEKQRMDGKRKEGEKMGMNEAKEECKAE